MAVTLIYEEHASPLGVFREAAVFETIEEALLQAAWDEMAGANRFPDRIVEGAHHGSAGWEKMRRGRPRWVDDAHSKNAHDAEARVVANHAAITRAVKVVRRHFVVHADDVANPKVAGAFGVPMVPVEPNDAADTPSPSVADCLAELRELVA